MANRLGMAGARPISLTAVGDWQPARSARAAIAAGKRIFMGGINPREIAIARRAVAQEAIRLANSGQIELKEKEGDASAAA